MNVQHFEKGVTYTDADIVLLSRKVGRLATYCEKLKDDASSIRIESFSRPTQKKRDQVKVMVNVELPGAVLRAESRREAAMEALDRCIEKLEPQIKKYKETHTDRLRRARLLQAA
jgi:ribosomal subunit interface protein